MRNKNSEIHSSGAIRCENITEAKTRRKIDADEKFPRNVRAQKENVVRKACRKAMVIIEEFFEDPSDIKSGGERYFRYCYKRL